MVDDLETTITKKWDSNSYLEIALPSHKGNEDNSLVRFYLSEALTFPKAKKIFKRSFLEWELQIHKGNVSETAQVLQINRKTIQRFVKEVALEANFDGLGSLFDYQKKDIRDVYGRNSIKLLCLHSYESLTWKEAEKEFERQFLEQALKRNDYNLHKTAKEINICSETLYRKIKRLAII